MDWERHRGKLAEQRIPMDAASLGASGYLPLPDSGGARAVNRPGASAKATLPSNGVGPCLLITYKN
jgi:hypothetical protein